MQTGESPANFSRAFYFRVFPRYLKAWNRLILKGSVIFLQKARERMWSK